MPTVQGRWPLFTVCGSTCGSIDSEAVQEAVKAQEVGLSQGEAADLPTAARS